MVWFGFYLFFIYFFIAFSFSFFLLLYVLVWFAFFLQQCSAPRVVISISSRCHLDIISIANVKESGTYTNGRFISFFRRPCSCIELDLARSQIRSQTGTTASLLEGNGVRVLVALCASAPSDPRAEVVGPRASPLLGQYRGYPNGRREAARAQGMEMRQMGNN